MTHALSNRQILISGAGISGLSFALAISKLWPSTPTNPPPRITLLERDTPESAARRPGYTLSLAGLEEASGLAALRDLGLLDEILKCAVVGLKEGSFKIWGPDWKEWLSVRGKPVKGVPVGAVRVARMDLRRVLVSATEACERVQVRWGCMVVGAERRGDERVEVTVRRGEGEGEEVREECDFLVVADGANSKVRASLRPGDGLEYTGAIQLVGVGNFPEGVLPPVDKNWGLQLSNGDGMCCFYSPSDKQNVLWALSFLEEKKMPKESYNSKEAMQPLLEVARERGKAFGPRFRRLVDATVDHTTAACLPAQDKKPFRHEGDGRIVFIGDSNHAVSPFAGYGANLALRDGWDLAKCLVEALTIEPALQKYDDLSYPRAVKILDRSRWTIKNGHSSGIRFWLFGLLVWVGGLVLRLLGKS